MDFIRLFQDSYNRKCDIRFLLPLYRLANVLAVAPPFSAEDEESCFARGFKYYSVVFAAFMCCGYVLSTYGRISLLYSNIDETLMVLDVITAFTLTACNVVTCCKTMWNSRSYRKMIAGFRRIDAVLNATTKVPKRYLALELLSLHLFLVAVYAFDAYIWLGSYGTPVYRCYVFRNLQYYQTVVLAFLVYHTVTSLGSRFKTVNKLLVGQGLNVGDGLGKPNFFAVCGSFHPGLGLSKSSRATTNVKRISELYSNLDCLVDVFNAAFGLELLLLILVILLTFLQQAGIALVFNFSTNKNVSGLGLSGDLVVLCIMWCSVALLMAFLIASSCDETAGEARRTSKICYRLLNKLETVGENPRERVLRKDLALLAKQTAVAPVFSAAGFLTVDYTILGFLISSVTTYIIVVIQLLR